MITIIGRGHSGTRAIAHTLYASGVYLGELLNPSGDLVPPDSMYEACRVIAQYVDWQQGLEWHFDKLHTMEIEPAFCELLTTYLADVLAKQTHHKGWKIPETTLVYPWLVRLYPDIKYIYWVRNPRDCILNYHKTDDLTQFGVPHPPTEDLRRRRAISWKYQYDLVQATPRPRHWLEVRFEDFVLRQDETLARLEAFLGLKLAKIPVRPEAVDRWKHDDGPNYYDFLAPAMQAYGYEIPEADNFT
jgi:hypothetical protein